MTDGIHRDLDGRASDGQLTPIAEVARELLDLLSGLVPYEAACISVYHPMTHAHETVAIAGCGEREFAQLDRWIAEFDSADPQAHDGVTRAPSWHGNMVTLSLYNAHGRYTGSLHVLVASQALDLNHRDAIDDQLVRVQSLLGNLIDSMRLSSLLTADVPASARGVVVLADSTVVHLPDRHAGQHLRDHGPLPTAIAAASQRGDLPERFRWRDDVGGWHLIQSRVIDAGIVITEDDAELPHGLTPREIEVLTLVVGGYTNPQIARILVVSDKTVAKHVEHVLDKLGCASRAAAAAAAVRGGLIELGGPASSG